jgi:Pvc16 N-terminal domain/Carboxypeptidase regulatory-like domain
MPLVVDIPLNTMLADLDESLRTLLQRELGRHGFDNVEVAFDAPAKEWSSQLAAPTVNVFLYDLRESTEHRHRAVDERRANGGAFETRPPLILECSYAITAWTQAVEDEHRLLSQILTILYSYLRLPADALAGRISNGAQRYPIFGKVGQPKADGKADFWNAVGGQYKASLDYVVTLSCEAGVAHERGPEVRDLTLRIGDSGGPPGRLTELHRVGGRVADGDGEPLAEAWITLPDLGRWGSSDGDGRFMIARVPPGEHRCVARTRGGDQTETTLTVPGGAVELLVGPATARRRAGSKR